MLYVPLISRSGSSANFCHLLKNLFKSKNSRGNQNYHNLHLSLKNKMSFSTTSSNLHDVKIEINPASCMADDSVSIKVAGLKPGQIVTLSADMKEIKTDLCCLAYYKADDSGCIDVSKMPSIGGRYTGVIPMGLIGGMKPAPHEKRQFSRYLKRDVDNPSLINFKVFDGEVPLKELYQKSDEIAKTTHKRHFIASGVTRIPVKYGKVRGSFFLPPGDGPFPSVIDMLGSAGGLLEYRAAMLANHGIAALALAYCAYDDLPKHLEEFHMSYFEEAIQFLLEQEKVVKPDVGVLGFSKSGDLALAMGTFIPEAKAIVNVNGNYGNIGSPLVLKDRTIPPLMGGPDGVKILGENLYDIRDAVFKPLDYPDTIIPLEEGDANFLFIVSGDDRNYNSSQLAKEATERLSNAGKNNFKVIEYEDAGHCLDPPHLPYCEASYHPLVGGNVVWGGKLKEHLEAQEKSWPIILNFFKEQLQSSDKSKL